MLLPGRMCIAALVGCIRHLSLADRRGKCNNHRRRERALAARNRSQSQVRLYQQTSGCEGRVGVESAQQNHSFEMWGTKVTLDDWRKQAIALTENSLTSGQLA